MIRSLTAIICAAGLLVLDARADDGLDFKVSIKNGEVIGSEPMQRAFVYCGTTEFLLQVPGGTRVDLTRTDRLGFNAPDLSFCVNFRIVSGLSSDAEAYRQHLLNRYPGAMITEESSARVNSQTVPVFDLRWRPSGTAERFVRVAFIPSIAGMLEFSLTTSIEKTQDSVTAFSTVLESCRSNEQGPIEIVTYTPGPS